jgi:trimeric autotransporter adhesin
MKTMIRMFLPALALSAASTTLNAQALVGITDNNQLFTLTSVTVPGSRSTPIALTGLTAGQTIAGIDYRPATGELFAMGYNSTNGSTQLYRVNVNTGALTAVNATPITLSLGSGSIGFDFNPTVDRIRVVGANRKNYRLNPLNGSIAATDVDLQYAAGDPNILSTPSVGAVAYTNSYLGMATTTLYDYDESLNILAIQNPPNNGTLNTVGSSGILVNNALRTVDMDIYFNPVNKTNIGYLSANTGIGTMDNLYTINLATGATSLIGTLNLAVKDIAILPASFTPPGVVTGQLVYALVNNNRALLSFDSNNPETVRGLVYITGVDSAHTLVGMDFRPADRELYALGYTGGTQQYYKLYRINTGTGVATAINTGNTDTLNLGPTFNIGFDFNPTVDRIRVVSSLGANYRLNPTTGAIVAKDGDMRWATGDVSVSKQVRVSTIAYTNSYQGATSTSLLAINDSGAILTSINPPNDGTLNTIALGIYTINPLDNTSDMEFFYDSTIQGNRGYLAANPGGLVDVLYTLSETGAVTAVDTIGYGLNITDIAVQPMYKNSSLLVKGLTSARSEFIIYPNPATTSLHMVLENAARESEQYQVRDITGRMLLQGTIVTGSKEVVIPLSTLAAGSYVISLSVNGSVYAPMQFTKL